MFGMDFFFKSVETGMKLTQAAMENMFRMVGFFAGLACPTRESKEKTTSKPAEKQEQTPPPQNIVSESAGKGGGISRVSHENMPPLKKSSGHKAKSPAGKKAAPAPQQTALTAIEQVSTLIEERKQGVTTEDIMMVTGFPRKKVQNIIYKLKKRGKIQASEKGLYVAI